MSYLPFSSKREEFLGRESVGLSGSGRWKKVLVSTVQHGQPRDSHMTHTHAHYIRRARLSVDDHCLVKFPRSAGKTGFVSCFHRAREDSQR